MAPRPALLGTCAPAVSLAPSSGGAGFCLPNLVPDVAISCCASTRRDEHNDRGRSYPRHARGGFR